MIEIRPDFLPLNRPSIGEAEIAAVTECLKSRWITTGPLCAGFEERFKTLTGARHAVSVVSATAGMHLVLMALGIGPGDEIITPSMTFASTVNMIALLGARPVFVDIQYDTLNIDCRSDRGTDNPQDAGHHPRPFCRRAGGYGADRGDRRPSSPDGHRRRSPCRRDTLSGNARRRIRGDCHLFLPSAEEHHDRRGRDDHPQRRGARKETAGTPVSRHRT